MSVFREITVEFGGSEYTFSPSNKLLRRIDAGLTPQTLFGVLNQMDGREAPLPALAYIISELLNAGGGKFTEDDVLGELYDDVLNNNAEGIRPLVAAIAECLTLPIGEKQSKNSPAPDSQTGVKLKKAKRPSE